MPWNILDDILGGLESILDKIVLIFSDKANEWIVSETAEVTRVWGLYMAKLLDNTDPFFKTIQVQSMFRVVTPVAYALLGLFFVIEFCKKSVYFETMSIEQFLKPLLMLIIGKIMVSKSGSFMIKISSINTSLTNSLARATGEDSAASAIAGQYNLQDTVYKKAAEGEGWANFFDLAVNGVIFIVTLLLLYIIIFVFCARALEMMILFIVSPIFFATLVGDSTIDVFKSFIKQYIAVVFQTIIIVIAVNLINVIVGDGTGTLIDPSDDTMDVGGILGALVKMVNMVLIVFIIMKAKPTLSKFMGR
jgi:hypothetical protein